LIELPVFPADITSYSVALHSSSSQKSWEIPENKMGIICKSYLRF